MFLRKIITSGNGIAAVALMLPGTVFAGFEVNMTKGVTSLSRGVYDLHMLALGMVSIIAAIVFGVMIWSLYHHRKSRGAVPAQFHHSTKWEVVWTVIPILVLIAFAAPATKTLVDMSKTEDPDLTIKITGFQWRWKYDYIDEDFGFFSVLAPEHNKARQKDSNIDVTTIDNYLQEVDQPIVIPVNKKVRLLTTSNDVIHAWWVPDLGWKRDAIPGFINDNWAMVEKEGTYYGKCAELCGKDHAYMPVVLKVVSGPEYQNWVREMKQALASAAAGADREWSMDELLERGQGVYTTNCVACHQADGSGIPPAFPALTNSPVTTGPVAEHINTVLNGRPGTTMQAFGSQLNVIDLAAVITYERNALGNSTGDVVQPVDIQAALQQ